LHRNTNRQVRRTPQDINGRKRQDDPEIQLALLLFYNRCSDHDRLDYTRRNLTPKTIFSSYNGGVRKSTPTPFKLHAGHPALELVNTLDMRFSAQTIELLPTYAELLRFTAQLQLLPAEQGRKLARTVSGAQAQRVLASTLELREALAKVLYTWADGGRTQPAQLEILERHFQAAALQRKLRADGPRLDWAWNERGTSLAPELPLWKLAQAASDLLVSGDSEHIKDCGDPTCRWLFLDLSKNHTRRWCDMKTCGNRMKARRHHARLQDSAL
jgi:predicted RNA-binding Zn ribbon-like protein